MEAIGMAQGKDDEAAIDKKQEDMVIGNFKDYASRVAAIERISASLL